MPGEAAQPVWAVVVARVGTGKSRLRSVLTSAERRGLTLAMLGDVLDACAACPLLAGTVAVVDTQSAWALATEHGAHALLDEPPGGLGGMNAAVQQGIDAAHTLGASTVIVLPGDVPLVSADDFAALLEAAGAVDRAVVVGSSADGSGTNALLLRPPHVVAPSFGPPSVERHLLAGAEAGARTRALVGLDLALDVDTPADLEAVLARARASATASALARLRVSAG